MALWITAKPEVFSRREEEDKLLLLHPGQRGLPPLFLLGHPAPLVWEAIGAGVQLGELLRRVEGKGIPSDAALGTLSVLQRSGLVTCEPPLEAGDVQGAAAADVLLDPWQYQFSRRCLKSPWYVLWEVTEACPRRDECFYCYRPDTPFVEAGIGASTRIIDEIVRSEVPFVTLLGGEPLCHRGIDDIIARLRSHRIYVKVISNGVMVDEIVAGRLEAAGLNQIALSLDGLDQETSDASRGAGAFAAFRSALAHLKARDLKISISLTVSSAVFEQLDRLPAFCRDVGVDEVYFSPLRAVDRARFPVGVSPLDFHQMARLHEVAEDLSRGPLNIVSLRECSCGRSSCVIHADGGVSPCPFGSGVFGNILEEDLGGIWSRMNDVALRLEGSSTCFRHYDAPAEVSAAKQK